MLVARALLNAACRGERDAAAVTKHLDGDLERARLTLTEASRDALATDVRDAVVRGLRRCRPTVSNGEKHP